MTSASSLVVRRWVLLAVTVGTPLIFITGEFTDPFNVPKFALLVLGTGLAAAMKISAAIAGKERGTSGGLWIPVLAICAPLVLSWAISPYRGWSLVGQYPRFQGLLPYLIFGSFGLLLVDAFRDRPLTLAWALTASGACAGAYGVAQSLGLDPLTWYVNGAPYPLTASTGGHTNYTGGFLAICLPVSLYLWAFAPRLRVLGAAATVFIGAGLLTSLSQGPWLAAGGGVAVVAASMLRTRIPRPRMAGIGAVALMASFLVAPVLISMVVGEGREGLFGGTSRSRATFWTVSVALALDSPIAGRGPNSFAVDGVRHRPQEDALRNGYNFTDDPHSVPMSFLANAGFLGLAGYTIAGIWVIRRYRNLDEDGGLGYAFAGAAIAYLLQALVGIDEPIQRVGMWVALAGLAISTAPPLTTRGQKTGRVRRAASYAVLALATVGVTTWTWMFLEADRNLVRAFDAVQIGDSDRARVLFESAIGFRDEYEFRKIYAEVVGRAGLREEDGGLVHEMQRVNGYLEDFPDHAAIATEAEVLHHWGHSDPDADIDALANFERLLRLDPTNPLVEVEAAEVLLDLDRTEEAVALLEPLTATAGQRAQDVWSMLAIARARAGDLEGASAALDQADRTGPETGCRKLIAHRLLDPPTTEAPQAFMFVCSPGLIDWYEDQESRLSSDSQRS